MGGALMQHVYATSLVLHTTTVANTSVQIECPRMQLPSPSVEQKCNCQHPNFHYNSLLSFGRTTASFSRSMWSAAIHIGSTGSTPTDLWRLGDCVASQAASSGWPFFSAYCTAVQDSIFRLDPSLVITPM